MRLRKKPELEKEIEKFTDIVFLHGKIAEDLSKHRSLDLELGSGKGRFLTNMGALYEDRFFIGVESQIDIVYYAAVKVREAQVDNVRFLHGNVNDLTNWFGTGQVDNIYINFCDPWPKARHAKRRLVARGFLAMYKDILKPNGSLYFKTDNLDLFNFGLEEFAFCALQVVEQTNDLHNSTVENLVKTEYEEKFQRLGMPINFCQVVF